MRRYQHIDDAWLDFYATDGQRARNALLLHYAPIAKYISYRMTRDNQPVRNLMAESMLALTHGELSDWTPQAVEIVRTACHNAINRHGTINQEGTP